MKARMLLMLVAAMPLSLAAQTDKSALHQWHDVIRDVYVDGELDRGIQVLMCDTPRRMALLSSKYQDAVVLDLTAKTVNLSPKSSLRLSEDRNAATSEAAAPLRSVGKYSAIDSTTYLLSAEGKSILIRSHTGVTGEMTEEKLYEAAPVWRSLMEAYKPQAEAVAALKSDDKQTSVTLVFGTWCPDSKNYVPRLLKALRAAGNNRLQLKLVGVDNQFRQPVAVVQPRGIINVPIVIVEQGGREIGRIIETPAAKTIEEDLAAVLANKPNLHKGRQERGSLIARGAYLYNSQGGASCGSETWEIYNTAEGGVLVHSQITVGDLSTEVFYRVDAARKTTFVELTKRRGDGLTRVRYTIEDRTMTARLRGNISGVVQQTLEIPARFAFSSPSVAAQGRGWPEATQYISELPSYFSPADIGNTVGTLEKTRYEVKSDAPVRVQAGEFSAKHIVRKSPTETSEWWLHSTLGVPVRGKVMGGMEYVLTSLEIPSASK
jgi:hypothetical protein